MKKFFIALVIIAQGFANSAIDQAVLTLTSYTQTQKKFGVQNSALAYGMKKALLMADLLFDERGQLLLDQKDAVSSAFLSAHPQEYEVNMAHVLKVLDSSWQPFFNAITIPKNQLILQGLFSTLNLSDRHAKVAVLAAMLAPYNQGPVGDCFAVTDVIRNHEEYLKSAASDYQSIIANGYISRFVDGIEEYFFFLPILADTDLNTPFNPNFSLLDAPGFAAASTLMGAHVVPDFATLIAKNLPSNPTPNQVITSMAQVISQHTQGNTDQLSSLGKYAFSCLTNNPILRATEAAFASMAEERPSGSIRQNIQDALSDALTTVLPDNQTFLDAFNQSYRLIYNLEIPLPVPAEDGSSTDGGFQLYAKTADSLGIRVETPQEFRQLVLHALDRAMIQDPKVIQYVNQDDFLKAVLWNYDPDNKKNSDPVQNYQKLSRTPMQSCDGDDPYAVDDIDTGAVYEKQVIGYTPNNMKDLISWCLTLAKKTPAGLYPMNSPQHAFNFVPATAEMLLFAKSNLTSDQWLKKNLILPGMQVSSKLMDLAIGKKVVQRMLNQGLANNQSLENLETNLANKKLSVSSWSEQFLSGVIKLYSDQADHFTSIFDAALLKSLPTNDQAILQQSVIRFAFTNWNEGTKDIYFCAFFNPRTQRIAFGTILEDNTELSPMNESDWVNHQKWDVDLEPISK